MNHELPESAVVSPDWLASRLETPGLVIVDTRKGDGYAEAHVPRARKLALDPLLHLPGCVIESDVFAAEMARLGVGPDTAVVAYDDGNNLFGARLWWVLRHYGHERVRVLDGGWDLWRNEGRPVSTSPAPESPAADFTPQINPALLAQTQDVRAAMDDPGIAILDVRSGREWLRAEPTEASLPGHVPGAIHMVWTEVVGPETHCLLPPDRLRAKFAGLGLRPGQQVIVYCHGGIRAAHTVLALTLAGYTRVRNYEGSWAEWSRQNMPVEIEPNNHKDGN